MPTLVIETATAACSAALIDSGRVTASAHEVVGRGHAERLVPMVAELLGGATPEAILVDCGPGSFTGVRVGIAAARGLAIGWGVPVTGYSSLALLAAQSFAAHPQRTRLAVVLEGGHGEVFMQVFASPFAAVTPLASLVPQAALAAIRDLPIVGSGVRRLLAIDPALDAEETLLDAAAAALLAPDERSLPPRPIYGRAPDAKPAAARTKR